MDAAIRAHLASVPDLAGWTAGRIYASQSLPAGYTVAAGPAILFSLRGGPMDYSSRLFNPSYQFRLFAPTESQVRAGSAYLFRALNDRQSIAFKFARLETLPAMLNDPDTHWPFMLAFYQFWIANPKELP